MSASISVVRQAVTADTNWAERPMGHIPLQGKQLYRTPRSDQNRTLVLAYVLLTLTDFWTFHKIIKSTTLTCFCFQKRNLSLERNNSEETQVKKCTQINIYIHTLLPPCQFKRRLTTHVKQRIKSNNRTQQKCTIYVIILGSVRCSLP